MRRAPCTSVQASCSVDVPSPNASSIRAWPGSSGPRLKSPVTRVARGDGKTLNGPLVVARRGAQARALVAFAVDLAQALDLRVALQSRPVLEVRRDDAHRARTAPARSASTATRGIDDADGSAGQGSAWRRTCSTGSRVAMALPKRRRRAAVAGMVGADAVDHRVAGQERRASIANWSASSLPCEERRGKVVGQLLHAEHVEVRERARVRDHARGVDAAVEPEEPLDVPGDELWHVSEFRPA